MDSSTLIAVLEECERAITPEQTKRATISLALALIQLNTELLRRETTSGTKQATLAFLRSKRQG